MLALIHWLYGNVLGNLVASVLTGGAVWLWAHRHIGHLHDRIDGLHDHLDEISGTPQGQHAATDTFPAVGGEP